MSSIFLWGVLGVKNTQKKLKNCFLLFYFALENRKMARFSSLEQLVLRPCQEASLLKFCVENWGDCWVKP